MTSQAHPMELALREAADALARAEPFIEAHLRDLSLRSTNKVMGALAAVSSARQTIAEALASTPPQGADDGVLGEIEVALDSIEDTVRGSLATGFAHGPLTLKDYAAYEQRVRADAAVIRAAMRRLASTASVGVTVPEHPTIAMQLAAYPALEAFDGEEWSKPTTIQAIWKAMLTAALTQPSQDGNKGKNGGGE